MRNRLKILLLMLGGASAAQAHVMLSPSSAKPGAHLTVQVEVGHGCSGAPTTALRIHIPAGVTATPQPKPGWTAGLEKTADGGRVAVWQGGSLAADKPDNFALMLTLPRTPGTLTFPATQICDQTRVEWNSPASGGANPGHPAPVLTVSPTPPARPMAMPGMANMPPM
jgi:uncharacterized protein YcnI